MESIDLLNLISKLAKQSAQLIETGLLPKGMTMGTKDGNIYVGTGDCENMKKATSLERSDFKGETM